MCYPHSPMPSIPVYTLKTCVRFRHARLRPRHPHPRPYPRHRVYAFKHPRIRPRCPRPRHPRARIQHLRAHNPRSHVQARCLASSGLDTYAGQRKRACRCRRCGTVVGRGCRCSAQEEVVLQCRRCVRGGVALQTALCDKGGCTQERGCQWGGELPESRLLYLLYLVHLTL